MNGRYTEQDKSYNRKSQRLARDYKTAKTVGVIELMKKSSS